MTCPGLARLRHSYQRLGISIFSTACCLPARSSACRHWLRCSAQSRLSHLEGKRIDYGLGLHKMEVPGQGTFWGHDGTVWGAGAISMTRADGKRQMSVMVNLMRWNKLDPSGKPQHHPIDDALSAFYQVATCGGGSTW